MSQPETPGNLPGKTSNRPSEPQATQAPDFELSRRGVEAWQNCQAEYNEMVFFAARVESMRRESKTIDESDFARARRYLLTSQAKDWLREIIGELITLLGGGAVLGIGIPLVLDEKGRLIGIFLVLLGLVMGSVGFLFRHYPFHHR